MNSQAQAGFMACFRWNDVLERWLIGERKMTELEAFESMYGKSYLRTKKPKEYAIVWEAWQAATKAEREACAKVCDGVRTTAEALNQREAACTAAECIDGIRMRYNAIAHGREHSEHPAKARVKAKAKKKPTLVQIEWRDPASDWPWFYLLKMRGEWMHLQGADYPDGSAKHVGDCIWVHKSDVRAMRSNAEARGAGTASAGLPSYAGDNNGE